MGTRATGDGTVLHHPPGVKPYYSDRNRLTQNQVAGILGVSRKTITRWITEGRLPRKLLWSYIQKYRKDLKPRPRGPKRDPESKRYTVYRHQFDRKK